MLPAGGVRLAILAVGCVLECLRWVVAAIAGRDGPEEARHNTGSRDESQRPTGTSTADDSTGADPQGAIDPDSPHLRPA